VQIVRDGQTRRAPIERVVDHITGVFVPIVTLLAIVTWLIWLTLGVSGAIPRSYLDISQGGWGELLPSDSLNYIMTSAL
jgi:Cu+-exporting ATPase